MKPPAWDSRQEGASLIEIVFAAGIVATLGVIAVPSLATAVDEARALAATRYVASVLRQARAEAVKRSASTALRFTAESNGAYTHAVYLDGNGDGVRQSDIDRGIDTEVWPLDRLSDRFPHVVFGALEGLPGPDPATTAPGSDPIRIGNTDFLSFSPLGTATPGSLYVLGNNRAQYVVRVLGETGRVRVLKFDRARRLWRPL